MNNINTVINRVKIENDKSKNFTERLMRKKTTNMAKNYISIKPQEVHLDANEILKITLKKQQEYKEKLIEDEKTKDNKIKELKYEVEILEQNEVELKSQLEVLLNNENETKIQMEINVKKEDELKIQQEIQEKKEQELKKQIDIQKKKEFEFKKQIEIRDTKPVVFKLVNVFQPVFMYNRKATGWGDIIRGSYFLIQYCEELDLDFDIDMSYHPISRFLEKYRKNKYYNDFFVDKEKENMKKNIYKNVVKFDETNFIPKVTSNKIILSNHRSIKEIKYKFNKYLNNVPFNCDIMESSIYTNENKSKLSNTKYIHTITFPIYNITYLQKERMKQEVEPCEEVKIEVQTIMNKLELVEERYVVLHIRCGDTYLLNKSKYFSKRFLSKVIEEVKSWLVFLENTRGTVINMNMNTTEEEDTLKTSVFCVADNNYIKQILINEFPFIKILMFDIKHTGEGEHLEEENVKNTVIEFSIMSKSKSIFAISAYDHGSGFSKWCAETYSIPYMCKYIPNDV